jgi:ketosteroid isomerase-like protein
LQRLSESDDVEVFEPRRFFADGDMVVVLGHYAGRVKATGRLAESDWAHAFTFRDGKVASWYQYYDSTKTAAAYEPATVATG